MPFLCSAAPPPAALALSLLSSLLLGGCERPPAAVPGSPAAASSGAAAVHGGEPSAVAESTASVPKPLYRGQVRLTGDLAQAAAPAVLFVQVKPRGQNVPLLIRKYDLADPALPAAVKDERRFDFELTHDDTMTGQPLSAPLVGELDIEALFDPTGGLIDKSVQVRQRQPLTEGFQELLVRR